MTHTSTGAATLLTDNLSLLSELEIVGGVLDLACGEGRNGLAVLAQDLPVTFADSDTGALERIRDRLSQDPGMARRTRLWQVDFEQSGSRPLADKCFDAVLVFNYLHRPLLPDLKKVIRPGGLIFYETFTESQVQFGRPTNPDYLLRSGELPTLFEDWELLHSFEGVLENPKRAKAGIIARRI